MARTQATEESEPIGYAHPMRSASEGDDLIGRPHTPRDPEDNDGDDVAHRLANRPGVANRAREEADEEELGQDDILEAINIDDLDLDDFDEPTKRY